MTRAGRSDLWWNVVRAGIALTVVGVACAILFAQSPSDYVQPRSGWLYVIDSNNNAHQGRVLVVDPSQRRVVSAFRSGYQPDAALAPTGTELYIASSSFDAQGQRIDNLEIVRTSDGTVSKRLENPDRAVSTLPIYSSRMVLTEDGSRLYQFKMHLSHYMSYFVDVVDTEQREMSGVRMETPLCSMPMLLPLPKSSDWLAIVCDETEDVRLLDWKASQNSSQLQRLVLASGGGGDTQKLPAIAFIARGKRQLVLIAGDGRNLIADAETMQVLGHGRIDAEKRNQAEGQGSVVDAQGRPSRASGRDWLAGRWIPQQEAILSPDRSRLYLRLSRVADLLQGRQTSDQIIVLDAVTLSRLQTIAPNREFDAIALSRDGGQLYTISSQTATVSMIDAANGREIGIIDKVGTTPLFAIVAP